MATAFEIPVETEAKEEAKVRTLAISTGNDEIDKKLGGGIPVGSLVLIEGASDSGKSVLTQQLTWGSLREGCLVSVLTTENTVRSLIRQMDSLSLEVLDYCLLGRLKIYPIKVMKSMDDDNKALISLMNAVMLQKGRNLVIMDSLTSFISHASMKNVISFFEECKFLCNEGMTIVLVTHSYAFDDATLARIGSMCDSHLRLTVENVGDRLMKMLEVAKVRGAVKNTGNVVSFDVEPSWGMKIIPFSKAKA